MLLVFQPLSRASLAVGPAMAGRPALHVYAIFQHRVALLKPSSNSFLHRRALERRRETDCDRKRQGWPQRRGDAQGVQVETDQMQWKEDALQSKQVFPTSFYVHCIHTVITPKWWNVLGSIEQGTKITFPPIETQGLCGLSSPTRNWTWATAEKALSSNHQTAREVPSRSESGIEPGPWQRTRWVLTTGLPGKSPQDHVWDHIYVNIFQYQQFF